MNTTQRPTVSVHDIQPGNLINLAHTSFTEDYWGERYTDYYVLVKSTREHVKKSGKKAVEVSFSFDGRTGVFDLEAGTEVPIFPQK